MRMDRFKPGFLLVAALLLAAGCAAEVSDEETEVGLTTQPYLLGPWDQRYNMYSYVTDHRLKVCITRNPGTTMSLTTLQNHISNAVSRWVNAVQPTATVTLFNTVSFGCPRIDNVPLWDFEVVLSPGDALAHTWDTGMEMFEGEGTNFGRVMLHEFGHAFQLADTYIGAGGMGCLPDHPNSVMCDSRAFSSLQTDDIRAARQSYREVHPNLYTGPRPFAQPASGRCMDVVAFGTANGSKVQIWDCPHGPTTNQVWKTIGTNKAIIGEGSNKCLEVENFGTHNGARVQIWDCHGGINQQWTINGADGTIRSKQTGKCIDVANFGASNGFGTHNGAFLQMWDCIPGAANQKWRMN